MFKQGNTVLFGLAMAATLGSGCTTIDDHVRVTDWPALKVIEHHVSHQEMRDNCARYTGPFQSPMACTLFSFDKMEAHIVVSKDYPSQWVLEHERLHAAGYDHVGSDGMQRMWDKWRAQNAHKLLAPVKVADARALVEQRAPQPFQASQAAE